MKRRNFLERLVQLFSAMIAGSFFLPVYRFIRGSVSEEADSSWYPVCTVDSLTEEVTQVQFTRLIRDGWLTRTTDEYVWVRRKPDGTVAVFGPHCTHLGCAYSWNPDARQFQCPCHGGKFDVDGNRTAGPPPRPLDRYETSVQDGVLRIGRLISRKDAKIF